MLLCFRCNGNKKISRPTHMHCTLDILAANFRKKTRRQVASRHMDRVDVIESGDIGTRWPEFCTVSGRTGIVFTYVYLEIRAVQLCTVPWEGDEKWREKKALVFPTGLAGNTKEYMASDARFYTYLPQSIKSKPGQSRIKGVACHVVKRGDIGTRWSELCTLFGRPGKETYGILDTPQ
jgi:hypothetical protein